MANTETQKVPVTDVQVRLPSSIASKLDEYRRRHPDIPQRGKVVRQALDEFLKREAAK